MSLHRLFSMPSGMNYVTPRSMSVVCRLFVMSSTMVLGGFLVVVGGVLKMFGCLRVVFAAFFDKGFAPRQFRTLRLAAHDKRCPPGRRALLMS